MAEKRVSVRLAVVGGREVRAELQGIGDAGEQGMRRLSREMDAANTRVAAFYRRVQIAAAAAAAAFAAGAAAMIRSGLQVIDNQAKLAASLGTTIESIQVLERAGDLAGVSMGEIEQATIQLTRRLSQAAAGTGAAVGALERLRLTSQELQRLPLDQRIAAIQEALARYVPEAERAAVASQLFGDRAALTFLRIDTATLRTATQDVRDFGVVVSQQDAAQIERTNDAISRLGLIWRGVSNQLAVAAAPALEAVADALAAISRTTGPLGQAIRLLFDNLGRLASIAAAFAAVLAGRWVAGMAAAALSVRGLATALVVLRGALIRTGIGALIVAAGELIYQLARLVRATGGFGTALGLLGDVAAEVWDRIGLLAGVLKARLDAAWSGIRASIADALQAASHAVIAFGNRSIGTFQGAFEAMVVIWRHLPRAVGDLTIQAANALIAGLESMLNGAVDGINALIARVNAALAALGLERTITLVPEVDLGRIDTVLANAAAETGNAARDAFAAAFETAPFTPPDLGLSAVAEAARAAADRARETATALEALAGAPLASLAALRQAMAAAHTEIATAADATERLDHAFTAIGSTGGDTADADEGAEEGAAGSAARAAQASQAAGETAAMAATQAATGWAAVHQALSRYTRAAMEWGQALGRVLTDAFRSAEGALVSFVAGGKVRWRDMVDSMLNDLSRLLLRRSITGPLASGLAGLFTVNALGGVYADGGRLNAYARGGVVTMPTLFAEPPGGPGLMGEAGPEAILPLTRLSSGNLGVEARTQPHYVIQVDARGSEDVRATAQAVEAAVDRALTARVPGIIRASATAAEGRVVDRYQRRGGRLV